MAIELKQNLKLSQQLVITPQLQQAIKLLQLSRIELAEMVKDELTENPVLEEAPKIEEEDIPKEYSNDLEMNATSSSDRQDEIVNAEGDLKEPKDFDWENYIQTYNDPGDGMGLANFTPDDEQPNYENMVSRTATLQEHLEWQVRMSNLSPQEKEIAEFIIGALDDNGYLTTNIEDLSIREGFKIETTKLVLKAIQNFDPIGVGASSLQECLLIQAKQFPEEFSLLEIIIKEHLNLLEKKDFKTLAKKIKVNFIKVKQLADIILNMEPKPGRGFQKLDTQYITPDVYIKKIGNEYSIILNDEGLPRLRVSNFYRKMFLNAENGKQNLKGKENDAKEYVQDKLKSALWLIKSIHQRQKTLYRVTKCITEYQREFLDKGINYLKPMILKDVAEEIGVHESTVSRATSNKYVHSPQGIFELKYFFNSAISTGDGLDVASEAVKQKIKLLVSNEDQKKPFSDQKIVELLKKDNIQIARRTVAKYREMLGILPSSKRKKLC